MSMVTLDEATQVRMPDRNGEGLDPSGLSLMLPAGDYEVLEVLPDGLMLDDGGGVNWILVWERSPVSRS